MIAQWSVLLGRFTKRRLKAKLETLMLLCVGVSSEQGFRAGEDESQPTGKSVYSMSPSQESDTYTY